jgi:hypothetical protein
MAYTFRCGLTVGLTCRHRLRRQDLPPRTTAASAMCVLPPPKDGLFWQFRSEVVLLTFFGAGGSLCQNFIFVAQTLVIIHN